jgi:hypothetical protein
MSSANCVRSTFGASPPLSGNPVGGGISGYNTRLNSLFGAKKKKKSKELDFTDLWASSEPEGWNPIQFQDEVTDDYISVPRKKRKSKKKSKKKTPKGWSPIQFQDEVTDDYISVPRKKRKSKKKSKKKYKRLITFGDPYDSDSDEEVTDVPLRKPLKRVSKTRKTKKTKKSTRMRSKTKKRTDLKLFTTSKGKYYISRFVEDNKCKTKRVYV